jgi:hypothetical protein
MRRDPRTLLTVSLLGAAALLGATACGSQEAADVGVATTGATTEPGGRMTTGISQPVVLQRTGGVAGLDDRLEVRPDGTCTVTTKGKPPVTRQLSEAELATIVDALQEAHLATLATRPASPPRSDELTYTIAAGGTTFRTTETAAPDAVRPLLRELGALFSSPGPTS